MSRLNTRRSEVVEKIQAIRGMNDVLPEQSERWRQLEQLFTKCMLQYGYQEIRLPIIESTHLFKRTIGEVTDIVEKEMYTFTDLNGDSLTLRPEGTAGCLRACLQHGLLHNQHQKLWYMGPMYRHEKPQKGRYRQFIQFGVEALGIAGVAIELELISLCQRLWKNLNLESYLKLQINSLGDLVERQAYKKELLVFLQDNLEHLDEDSLHRLHKNPLRILDSKNPQIQALLQQAPKLLDYLGANSKQHFLDLCAGLDKLNIAFEINPFLVRGLDYYGHSVFEWVTDQLGSQATVCAGGRYDALVEQLQGKATPAVGLAMGAERLLLLLETLDLTLPTENPLTFFIIAFDKNALLNALSLAETLRGYNPHWQVITHTLGGSFSSQFKKADKSGANFAIIIGEQEMINQQVSVKNLRNHEDQVTIAERDLVTYIQDYLDGKQEKK